MFIVPFHPDHLGEALMQGAYVIPIQDQTRFLNVTAYTGDTSIAFTAYGNSKILGMGGFIEIYPHLVEAWVIISTQDSKYNVRLGRTIVKMFRKIMRSHPSWQRIQAAVRKDFDEAKRLIEFLGFQNEGLMRKFGPDKSDYYRYAVVRNGPN